MSDENTEKDKSEKSKVTNVFLQFYAHIIRFNAKTFVEVMSSFLISLNFEINESATAILDIKIFNVSMKNNFILPIFVFIYFFHHFFIF